MQIPDYYEFFNQAKIMSGKKAMEHLPFDLRGFDAQKPLVITSPSVSERGLLKSFINAFADSTISLGAIYDRVPDYAGITLVNELAVLFRARGCDSIIAIGGGPVVDAAKALNILISEKTDDLFAYFNGTPLKKQLKPLVVIPSGGTSGTEISGTVTVDNRTLTSDFLFPTMVVMDPRMTPGCCSECAAESAAVMLTQAVEIAGYGEAVPMAEAYAEGALQLLAQFMAKGVKRPKNKVASLGLANAAVMASIAGANKPAGMVYLLANELAKATGISPATCMGIILPFGIGFRIQKKTKFRDGLLMAIAGFDRYSVTPEKERPARGAESAIELHAILKRFMPENLRSLNVQKYLLPGIAEAAAAASGERFTGADCQTVLAHAWEGTLF